MRRDPVYTYRARELRRNASDAEKRMWHLLRGSRLYGYKFRRQHAIGQSIADFVCLQARLVIEVDGETHGNDAAELADAARTDYLERRGFRVVRFWNDEVLSNMDGVVESLLSVLGGTKDDSPSPHPDPLPCGERET